MNAKEAYQALIDGKKVTNTEGDVGHYFYMDDFGEVCNERKESHGALYPSNNYEIYKEPKEQVPMWQWRVWSKRGNIEVLPYYYPQTDIDYMLENQVALKAEKIGEPVFLIPGQDGYEE